MIFQEGTLKTFCILLLSGLITAASPVAGQKSQPRVDEIGLEAFQGTRSNSDFKPYGPCFKITLRRDGTALFTGKAKVKLIGDFQGTISIEEFEKLLSFLVARHYSKIPDDPLNHSRISDSAGTDWINFQEDSSPAMITSVVYEGGKTKIIGRLTDIQPVDRQKIPKELFEIEQAVFDTATRIRWAKTK